MSTPRRRWLTPRNDDEMRRMEEALLCGSNNESYNQNKRELRLNAEDVTLMPLGLYRFMQTSPTLTSFELKGCRHAEIASGFFHSAARNQKLVELRVDLGMEKAMTDAAVAESLSLAVTKCPLKRLSLSLSDGFDRDSNETFSRAFLHNQSLEEIRCESQFVTSNDVQKFTSIDRTVASIFQEPRSMISLQTLDLKSIGSRTATSLGGLLQSPTCSVNRMNLWMDGDGFESSDLYLLGWEQLTNGLKRSVSVKQLELCFTLLPEIGSLIKDVLNRPTCGLEFFALVGVDCAEESYWRDLVEGISKASTLVHLKLVLCCCLTQDHVYGILKQNKSLQGLELDHSDFSPLVAQGLAMHPHMKKIVVSRSDDDEEPLSNLKNVLYSFAASSTLQHLCLRVGNSDREEEWLPLLVAFLTDRDSSRLTKLEMLCAQMGSSGFRILLEALKHNKTLFSLVLNQQTEAATVFRDEKRAFRVLIECFPMISNLKKLDVQFSSSPECVTMLPSLVEGLLQNHCLTRLDLGELKQCNPILANAIDFKTSCTQFLGVLEKHSYYSKGDDDDSPGHGHHNNWGNPALLPRILASLLQDTTASAGASVFVYAIQNGQLQIPGVTNTSRSTVHRMKKSKSQNRSTSVARIVDLSKQQSQQAERGERSERSERSSKISQSTKAR